MIESDLTILRGTLLRWARGRVPSEADAEDVVQDVLVRLWSRGADDVAAPSAFVWQAARNAVIDHHRRRGSRAGAHDRAGDDPTLGALRGVDAGPTSEEDRAFLVGCMRPFVERLDPPYREALTLTDLGGLTQAEAAALLGLSISGLKSRVQRGRAALKADLLDCCAVAVDARGRALEAVPHGASCGCPPPTGSAEGTPPSR